MKNPIKTILIPNEHLENLFENMKVIINKDQAGKYLRRDELCSICQKKLFDVRVRYDKRDSIMVLDCNHEFHEDCLKQWLKCSSICPNCRKNVRSDGHNHVEKWSKA